MGGREGGGGRERWEGGRGGRQGGRGREGGRERLMDLWSDSKPLYIPESIFLRFTHLLLAT